MAKGIHLVSIQFFFFFFKILIWFYNFIKKTFGNKQMKESTKIFVSWFFIFSPGKFSFWQRIAYHRGEKKNHSLGKHSTTSCFPRLCVYCNPRRSSSTAWRCQDYTSKPLLRWPLISPVDPRLCCPSCEDSLYPRLGAITLHPPCHACVQQMCCCFLIETPRLSGIQGKHFLPARTGSRDNWFSHEIIFLLQAIGLMCWKP